MAGPLRVNWQERLEQEFQSRQAQRQQNRGGRRQGQNEGMPMVAGPSAPVEGRVNWQERLEQGFQTRHAQRSWNHGDQNNRPPQQFIMGRQEMYAEEERQHAAHREAIQRQRQMDHDQEALQHQARMMELQRQRQHQMDMEALQHQAHQDELQRQQQHQREMEVLQHQAHLAELQRQQQHQRQMDHDQEASQHQDNMAELQRQEEQQRQMDHDQEDLEQQNNATQQQQMDQQAEVERIQVAINNNQALAAIPKACRPYHDPAQRFSLGPMSVECPHCHALHFKSERLTNSSNIRPKFGLCCLQGQIQLPPLAEPPQLLRKLLTSSTPRARNFREMIRQYNCAFAFTSVAVNVDEAVLRGGGGPYSFKIHGALHHHMGALHNREGRKPSYAQLYIYDEQAALAARNTRNPNLNNALMADLQDMLNSNNPFVPLYKQAYQIMQETPPELQANVRVALVLQPGDDPRRYNLPTANDVAAIIPGSGEEDVDEHRGIMLRYKNGGLRPISHLNPLYSPLHYIMLFPKGDHGWHPKIDITQPEDGSARSKYISQRCYYAFRLHPRPMEPSDLLRGGRLFQQYIVDAWASIEQSELNWFRNNQKTIRADLYDGLRDALRGVQGVDLGQMGKRIVLPASHPGSARHMYQLFQDSMAIARHCGKPDIFLTMTANPNWAEIQDNLLPYEPDDDDPNQREKHQTASDRPDIVACVFAQKIKAMLKDIKDGVFGDVHGYVFTVEFQKRGLPHIHLLIFLKHPHKIRDAAHVDSIVSAQIPDPVAHPMLYETITKCMMHGPCGPEHPTAVCMVNGKCGKHFPKDFCPETRFGEDGYPEYARPEGGRTYTNAKGHTFDNRNVIPYNPFLSARYI